MLKLIAHLFITLFLFGCVRVGALDMETNKTKEASNESFEEMKIIETTVGEICGERIGVGNIYRDNDSELRATLSVLGKRAHRVAKGEIVPASEGDVGIKEIVELPSKGDRPGGSMGYVILSCLSTKKPHAAPEGISAWKMNKPNARNKTKDELVTIEGKAEWVKGGLMVNSTLIGSIGYPEGKKYTGKIVEVKGYVRQNSCEDGAEFPIQCYSGQYMTKIKSIKIVEK